MSTRAQYRALLVVVVVGLLIGALLTGRRAKAPSPPIWAVMQADPAIRSYLFCDDCAHLLIDSVVLLGQQALDPLASAALGGLSPEHLDRLDRDLRANHALLSRYARLKSVPVPVSEEAYVSHFYTTQSTAFRLRAFQGLGRLREPALPLAVRQRAEGFLRQAVDSARSDRFGAVADSVILAAAAAWGW